MAVNDVLGQLQLLLKTSTPLIEAGGEGAEALSQLTPGQQVEAKVLAPLPGGRFLVLVDDQHLDLNLPRNTQPGTSVDLRFVGSQPRPIFILDNQPPQAAARAPVNLSDTARLIGALLNKANQLSTQESSPLGRAAPILNGPPTVTAQFAEGLRAAIAQSGLFYESHQAQWVAGQRTLGELLREPQAQLSDPRVLAGKPGPDRATLAPQAAVSPSPQNPSDAAGTNAGSRSSDAVGSSRDVVPQEPVHPNAAPIVQQQLDAIDTRQIVWQGQVWPGQTMRWEVEERPAREGEPESPQEWQTRLSLALPQMGEIDAQLRLSANGIRIELTAAQADTMGRLQSTVAQLKDGFDRSGLNLTQLTVKRSGQA
jgi:hypothetical protein